MSKQLRRVARSFLGELGPLSPPIEMFEIARDCGFDIYPASPVNRPGLVGDEIILVDVTAPRDSQQYQVAYALARWALFRAQIDYSERGAKFIAQALLAGQVPNAARPRTPPSRSAHDRRAFLARVVSISRGPGRTHRSRHTTEGSLTAIWATWLHGFATQK